MISFEEALGIILDTDYLVGSERVGLANSLHRVLAEDILSDIDMPPFHKSAVDGYACRRADLGNDLHVIEIIPAGKAPEKVIGPNQCAKIMTGAPMPEGADCVIMVEDVKEVAPHVIKYGKEKVKENICFAGEDIRKEDLVLCRGTRIEPQHIAVLATAGCVNPLVYRKVRVAVISTGDEIIEPNETPQYAQIRNSNAYQLMAQIVKFGGIPDYCGIALDTMESTRKKITRALDGNEIVLLTGGVSMGDYDHVPAVFRELDIDIKFKSIAMQPGRPTLFGMRQRQFIFGLPGNPVSGFLQFELLVKPLLSKISGHEFNPMAIRLPMGRDYQRKKSERLSWLPVRILETGEVLPLEYHGSAHINSLVEADGFISMAIGQTELRKGDIVHVRPI
ncbi:MAG: gephyrin-like molybdotransferase Glp [Bacteroidales bacterium]